MRKLRRRWIVRWGRQGRGCIARGLCWQKNCMTNSHYGGLRRWANERRGKADGLHAIQGNLSRVGSARDIGVQISRTCFVARGSLSPVWSVAHRGRSVRLCFAEFGGKQRAGGGIPAD